MRVGTERRVVRAVVVLSAAVVLAGGARRAALEEPTLRVPPGLPAIPPRTANPPTTAKVALGEKLFFEPRLSVDSSVSCATCHRPERYFTDDAPLSRGVAGALGEHNAPSILNAVYAPHFFWDGRSASLEDQVRYPVTHPREMNSSESRVVALLQSDAEYPALFQRAFDDKAITWARVAAAIASFERTLLSGNSAFDRFILGDATAISASAKRGFELFRGRAGCASCHTYTKAAPFFSDFQFHNTGAGWSDPPNLGRYHVTKAREDKGAFRTPGLRNVAKTAPYMHDGHLTSLSGVVDFYDRGGTDNPFLDGRIKRLGLSEPEKSDLLAFLESLTGDNTHARLRP